MTVEHYEKKFREIATNAGFSEDKILYCLHYANPLISKKVPVIYSTANLAALVGYNKIYLKRAVLYTSYFYRKFEILKKNNQKRTLYEPLPGLKEIQIWILKNILYKLPVSRFAKAYIPNRGLLDNVKFHKAQEEILCLDIKNFFPCITQLSVEQIFLNIGYSSNISNLLSKICTLENSLPQGAPTSAYISNLYLNEFDDIIASFCTQHSIRYTRYADDLTFSSNTHLKAKVIIDFVAIELGKLNLELNIGKTKLMQNGSRKVITGVVVNEKIQLQKSKRKEIRKEVYYLLKFGLLNHLEKINSDKANYISHLLGKINFAIYLNPHDQEMIDYKKKVIETFL